MEKLRQQTAEDRRRVVELEEERRRSDEKERMLLGEKQSLQVRIARVEEELGVFQKELDKRSSSVMNTPNSKSS